MTRRALAVLAALAAAAALLIAPSAARASTIYAGGLETYNRPVCGASYVPVDLGRGNYFNVYNEQDNRSCISVEEHHLAFTVTSRDSADSWQYPNISSGWEWGRYTCQDGRSALPTSPGSQCMRYPVQEKSDGTPLTSVSYSQHLGSGNVSYDIWFNRADATPGQDDGTEVMIWLAHPGVAISARSVCWTATIQGRKYDAMCWRAKNKTGVSWNYVAYVAVGQTRSLPPTFLNGFFRSAIAHGKLSPDWWLTAIDFGAAINTGVGFAVGHYSLEDVR
jgi:Glycosyl hydrolase family 12